jgi:poly-gamma-glutamate synthase PgsB/CapB
VEVMGYSLQEIANALGKTIPRNQHLFTSEHQTIIPLKEISKKQKTSLHFVDNFDISDEEMKGFKYIEHKENVSLALAVCTFLDIDRKTALKGMYKAIPDAGVLKLSKVTAFQKNIYFYNAFAANDPQSTLMIWEQLKINNGFSGLKFILLNTRQDRFDRARQLAAMVGTKLNDDFDYLILIGQSTEMVEDLSVSNGVKRNKIINLGWTEPEEVFEATLAYTEKESTVLAIGNMGGMGGKVVEYFENRSVVHG